MRLRSECRREYPSLIKKFELGVKVLDLFEINNLRIHPILLIPPEKFVRNLDRAQYDMCRRAENAKDEEAKVYHTKKREVLMDQTFNLTNYFEACAGRKKIPKKLSDKIYEILETIEVIFSLSYKELQATKKFQELNVGSQSGLRRSGNL